MSRKVKAMQFTIAKQQSSKENKERSEKTHVLALDSKTSKQRDVESNTESLPEKEKVKVPILIQIVEIAGFQVPYFKHNQNGANRCEERSVNALLMIKLCLI